MRETERKKRDVERPRGPGRDNSEGQRESEGCALAESRYRYLSRAAVAAKAALIKGSATRGDSRGVLAKRRWVASGARARGARARGAMAREAMARGAKSGGRGRRDNALPIIVFSPRVAFPAVVKKDFRHGYLF